MILKYHHGPSHNRGKMDVVVYFICSSVNCKLDLITNSSAPISDVFCLPRKASFSIWLLDVGNLNITSTSRVNLVVIFLQDPYLTALDVKRTNDKYCALQRHVRLLRFVSDVKFKKFEFFFDWIIVHHYDILCQK